MPLSSDICTGVLDTKKKRKIETSLIEEVSRDGSAKKVGKQESRDNTVHVCNMHPGVFHKNTVS